MFVKIRMTWFPVDAIDQIDEIGERLRVQLSTGIKIDLDPIEGEKVLKQLGESASHVEQMSMNGLVSRLVALESRVMSLHASVAALEASVRARGRMKANA